LNDPLGIGNLQPHLNFSCIFGFVQTRPHSITIHLPIGHLTWLTTAVSEHSKAFFPLSQFLSLLPQFEQSSRHPQSATTSSHLLWPSTALARASVAFHSGENFRLG
jgi:hypothetical protein